MPPEQNYFVADEPRSDEDVLLGDTERGSEVTAALSPPHAPFRPLFRRPHPQPDPRDRRRPGAAVALTAPSYAKTSRTSSTSIEHMLRVPSRADRCCLSRSTSPDDLGARAVEARAPCCHAICSPSVLRTAATACVPFGFFHAEKTVRCLLPIRAKS